MLIIAPGHEMLERELEEEIQGLKQEVYLLFCEKHRCYQTSRMYEMLAAFTAALFHDDVLPNAHKTSSNQHCSSFKL